MDLEKFKNEKIAIFFENEQEKKEFLLECDKNNISWGSGTKARDLIPSSDCIVYNFDAKDGLSHSSRSFYIIYGYEIINYKDFKKNKCGTFKEIKNIVVNKVTTVVFWKDGTKTLVKREYGQTNNPELAILYAYFYKHSGLSKTEAKKVLQELIDNIHVQEGKNERKQSNY